MLTKWPECVIKSFDTTTPIMGFEFRNCQTLPLRWLSILEDICHSPTVEEVSFVDCNIMDCKLDGEDTLESTPEVLVAFEEVGATRWVGNAEIRKGLMQIGRRMIQRWGPPPASAILAIQAAQLFSNLPVALPTSTQ